MNKSLPLLAALMTMGMAAGMESPLGDLFDNDKEPRGPIRRNREEERRRKQAAKMKEKCKR